MIHAAVHAGVEVVYFQTQAQLLHTKIVDGETVHKVAKNVLQADEVGMNTVVQI